MDTSCIPPSRTLTSANKKPGYSAILSPHYLHTRNNVIRKYDTITCSPWYQSIHKYLGSRSKMHFRRLSIYSKRKGGYILARMYPPVVMSYYAYSVRSPGGTVFQYVESSDTGIRTPVSTIAKTG